MSYPIVLLNCRNLFHTFESFSIVSVKKLLICRKMAMMMEEDNKDKGVPISFGTTQDRKLFPHHCAFNRLGNLDGIRGETHLGPDKYNVDKVCV